MKKILILLVVSLSFSAIAENDEYVFVERSYKNMDEFLDVLEETGLQGDISTTKTLPGNYSSPAYNRSNVRRALKEQCLSQGAAPIENSFSYNSKHRVLRRLRRGINEYPRAGETCWPVYPTDIQHYRLSNLGGAYKQCEVRQRYSVASSLKCAFIFAPLAE